MNVTEVVSRAFAEPGPEHWPVYAGLALLVLLLVLLVVRWIRAHGGKSQIGRAHV